MGLRGNLTDSIGLRGEKGNICALERQSDSILSGKKSVVIHTHRCWILKQKVRTTKLAIKTEALKILRSHETQV
ncbi:hypothetical protein M0802_005732 [Mischocyttarus mexicanus]|nr:hypothetical protein M0802_005732 [Mischocyttarus mexicanus]